MMKWLHILSILAGLGLSACSPHMQANETGSPPLQVGILNCRVLPHSGISLLIHSTSGVLCKFTPRDGGPIEHYKGETGIGFGVDVNTDKQHTSIRYSVLANNFQPGTHQLAGNYSGMGGGVSFGLSVGNSAPISKQDGSVSLQPIANKDNGDRIATGFTYMHLEARIPAVQK